MLVMLGRDTPRALRWRPIWRLLRHRSADANPSAGHAVLALEQVSATSHVLLTVRQVTVGATAAESGAHVPEGIPVRATEQA